MPDACKLVICSYCLVAWINTSGAKHTVPSLIVLYPMPWLFHDAHTLHGVQNRRVNTTRYTIKMNKTNRTKRIKMKEQIHQTMESNGMMKTNDRMRARFSTSFLLAWVVCVCGRYGLIVFAVTSKMMFIRKTTLEWDALCLVYSMLARPLCTMTMPMSQPNENHVELDIKMK